MPCFGENRNAIKNIAVAAKAMTGPDGMLCKKLIYKPMTEAEAPKNEASTIIMDNRFVNKYAVDAGVINIETTRITPTVCNEATVTRVNNTIIP